MTIAFYLALWFVITLPLGMLAGRCIAAGESE